MSKLLTPKKNIMIQHKSTFIFLLFAFATIKLLAQANPTISVIGLGTLNPTNSGEVALGAILDLRVDIGNTGSANIVASKLRPVITVPPLVTFLPDAQQTGLPAGWVIVSNTGSQLRICNGSDIVPGSAIRTIILKVQGATLGGPQTFLGQLNFGGATCAVNGPAPSGNNIADDVATSTITVVPAPACAIAVSASAGTIACNGGTTTLTATATGTSNPVEYSLNGGTFQSANTFTVNAAGSPYTVTAREVAAPTCTATATAVTVTQPAAFVPGASVTSPIAVAGGQGTITVTGGVSYVITSGPTTNTTGASSGVFSGLLAGTYTFTGTNAAGCTGISGSVVLSNGAAACVIAVSASAPAILCNGGTTTITATATGAVGAVEYSINGGTSYQAGNTFVVNGSASPYTIIAREVSRTTCSATSSTVTVANPTAVTGSAAVTQAISAVITTGTVTVTGAGGSGPYSYVIASGTTINTTGAATGVFTGLAAGSYTFTVTGANACTGTTAAVALAGLTVPIADPAVGQMNFTTTLGASQDANSLVFPDTINLNIPFYNLDQVRPLPTGTITIRVNLGKRLGVNLTAGNAPLPGFFTWASTSFGPVANPDSIVITGTQIAALSADFVSTLTFRVFGRNSCTSNVSSRIEIINSALLADQDLQNNRATLQYNLPVTVGFTRVNVTCNGFGNGIINLFTSPGTTVITRNAGGTTVGTTNTVTGLVPGTYFITASATGDLGNTCSATASVVINQPNTLVTSVFSFVNNVCNGASDGRITAVAQGGTAPYAYLLLSGATPTGNITGAANGIFTGVPAGVFTIRVTDANGCTATTTVTITQPVSSLPDISLGSDITSSFFGTPGVQQTIVYNVSEVAGNPAVGDTIRITKISGFTIGFNPATISQVVGSTIYTLDNARWKIDNSNPAFVSIILQDPSFTAGIPGTLLCNERVFVSITLLRNTPNISTFTLSARLRRANGEVNLDNNLNSIIMAAE